MASVSGIVKTAIAAVIWSYGWTGSAHAECRKYELTLFTHNGCGVFDAHVAGYGIASNGMVCGRFSCLIDDRSFIWTHGATITPIPTVAGFDYSMAVAINSQGTIVGQLDSKDGGASQAFIYRDGSSQVLEGLIPSEQTEVFAINDAGVVVGTSATPEGKGVRAFRWIEGRAADLNTTFDDSIALNVNDKGVIVGYMGFPFRAFLWKDGVTIDLGVPKGAWGTDAYGINEEGTVVGQIRWAVPPGGSIQPRHPFVWKNGVMTDIGIVQNYQRGRALSVDDNDVVLVEFSTPGTDYWLYKDGVFTRLRDYVVGYPQVDVEDFVGWRMNRHGQFTGATDLLSNDGYGYAFLLSPVPAVEGDTNCDRVVDVNDLTEVILNWADTPGPAPFSGSADVNEDGVVDGGDLVDVINGWTTESGK